MFKPVHCRMARAALNWSIRDLAVAAGINFKTIARFESGSDPKASTRDTIIQTLHKAGVRFRPDGSVWTQECDIREPEDQAA